jgi:hypothetical protein
MGETGERHHQTHETPTTRSASLIWWLIGVWLASALYVAPFVDRAWVPHDEGLLGQSAERVFGGQLPHRDFDEVYTGGLSYLHAFAFRLAGVRSIALRWTVFAFLLAWVPVVFWIASRSVRPPAAALVTALAVTWSMPNYFASMPSWYNLFFATFGIAALIRHLDTGRVHWLFAAGVAGGVRSSSSLRVVRIAGAVLFLLVNEVQASSLPVPSSRIEPRRRGSSPSRHRSSWGRLRSPSSWSVRRVARSIAFEPPRLCSLRRAGGRGLRLLVWNEIAWGRRPVAACRSSVSARPPFLAGVAMSQHS